MMEPGHSQAAGPACVRNAAQLIRRDRQRIATKVLVGNGVAPANKTTRDALGKLHARYDTPLVPPEPDARQVEIDPAECLKQLMSRAGNTQTGIDTFGWADDMLLVLRGRQDSPIWAALTSLMATIVEGDLPLAVRYLLTCGALTAIKVPQEVNQARVDAGDDPKIRPVNGGMNLLKQTLRVVSQTSSAERVKKGLRPFQLGLGATAGPERMAIGARALYLSGFVLGAEDAKNAFCSLKRQEILNSTSATWPEGVEVCNTVYGLPSISFYSYSGPTGNRVISTVEAHEGTRQGCVLGSFLFDNTVHHRIYARLKELFPHVIIRALTDDCIPAFRPPSPDGPYSTWDELYQDVAAFWTAFDKLANPIGIFREPSKSKLLIPSDAPEPSPDLDTGGLQLRPVRDGCVIAGCPIGTDSYIQAHAAAQLEVASKRIDDICLLARDEPQMAIRLLGSCANKALGYYTRVTPPGLLDEMLHRFDERMSAARTLCLRGDTPSAPPPQRNEAGKGRPPSRIATHPRRAQPHTAGHHSPSRLPRLHHSHRGR